MLQELLLAKMTDVRFGLIGLIERFSEDELVFRPAENAYSVRDLVLHIAHEQAIEVHWGLAGLLPEMPPAYDAGQFATIASLLHELEETQLKTLAFLEGLTDAGLESETRTPWGQIVRPVDQLWHVIEHEVHHRGELSLIVGLLGRPGLDA